MNSTEHGALELHEAEAIKPSSVGEGLSKDMRNGHCRTAHNMSSSSLRKKSDLSLLSKVRCGILRNFMSNLHEIFLGTKLFVLFPAVPLAIAAQNYGFGRAWVFALSLLGLTPLAERVSFLTDIWLRIMTFGLMTYRI